jgi:hypothetical protein
LFGSRSMMIGNCSPSLDMDRVQRRTRHQVKTNPRASPGLRLPDDRAEWRRCADPSEGDAGPLDDRRRAGRVDGCTIHPPIGQAATRSSLSAPRATIDSAGFLGKAKKRASQRSAADITAGKGLAIAKPEHEGPFRIVPKLISWSPK